MSVIGATGGVGQPLSLLLKQSPLIGELSLYGGVAKTPGVAADLSYINTPVKVKYFNGSENLIAALQNADIVVIAVGASRKPGKKQLKSHVNRKSVMNRHTGLIE